MTNTEIQTYLDCVKYNRKLLTKFERYLKGSNETFTTLEKDDLAVWIGIDDWEYENVFNN